jgi:hypothetical protein
MIGLVDPHRHAFSHCGGCRQALRLTDQIPASAAAGRPLCVVGYSPCRDHASTTFVGGLVVFEHYAGRPSINQFRRAIACPSRDWDRTERIAQPRSHRQCDPDLGQGSDALVATIGFQFRSRPIANQRGDVHLALDASSADGVGLMMQWPRGLAVLRPFWTCSAY